MAKYIDISPDVTVNTPDPIGVHGSQAEPLSQDAVTKELKTTVTNLPLYVSPQPVSGSEPASAFPQDAITKRLKVSVADYPSPLSVGGTVNVNSLPEPVEVCGDKATAFAQDNASKDMKVIVDTAPLTQIRGSQAEPFAQDAGTKQIKATVDGAVSVSGAVTANGSIGSLQQTDVGSGNRPLLQSIQDRKVLYGRSVIANPVNLTAYTVTATTGDMKGVPARICCFARMVAATPAFAMRLEMQSDGANWRILIDTNRNLAPAISGSTYQIISEIVPFSGNDKIRLWVQCLSVDATELELILTMRS